MRKYFFKDFYSYLFLLTGCIAVGCYVICFLANREFWLDEAFLGMNILTKNYLELWLPLDFKQVAPPLLLMISKFFYQFSMGLSAEQSMRFYPFLCGVASIPLFFQIAKKLIRNRLILFIVFLLFCFNSRVIYYTQEFKQYISDTFWGLFIIWIFLQTDIMRSNFKKLFFYGLLIGCLLFLSYTTIFFVAAGLGMLFFEKKCLVVSRFKIDRKIFNKFLFLGTGYLIPFSLLLLLDVYNPHHEFMNLWWSWYGAFLKSDFSNLFVVFYAFLDFFFYGGTGTWTTYPTGVRLFFYDIPFILWILSIFMPFLFFKQVGKKFLYFPFFILVILFASYLKLYPAIDRTLLYYYPLFLIMFGIYADSKIKLISYFSRFFLILILLAISTNSSYVMHTILNSPNRVRNSIPILNKLSPEIIPIYINQRMLFTQVIPVQQDHGSVFIFYKNLLHYNPKNMVRYPDYINSEYVSQNCFSYFYKDLTLGQQYALIWEDKFPLDCFVRLGMNQSFKQVGKYVYLWTQK